MKFREFASFITIQTIMVSLLTFNPVVSHFGTANAAEQKFTAEARAGLEQMFDIQGSIRGFKTQERYSEDGPLAEELGQTYIASLKGKDKEILATPKGAKFLKEHSRLVRLLAMQEKLEKCVKNKKSKRNLGTQIVIAAASSPYIGGCDPLATRVSSDGLIVNKSLNDLISDVNKTQKSTEVGGVFDYADLQNQLHLQALKNSMASYMSNRYKYEEKYINPETGAMSENHKEATVKDMCKDETGKVFCDKEMKKKLHKFATQKAIEIAATQKKSSYSEAHSNLRESFERLNPILAEVNIKVKDGFIDSADMENEATRAQFIKYEKAYIEELQKNDGTLMMSDAIKEKSGGFRTKSDGYKNIGSTFSEKYTMEPHDPDNFTIKDLKEGQNQIQSKVIAQAKQLNSLQRTKKNQEGVWKYNGSKNDHWLYKDKISLHADRVEDISKLVKTNPAAVGQVLLANPEYSDMVCAAINKIDQEDKSDEKWDRIWMIGGLVVGGVLIAGAAACAFFTLGLCTPISAAMTSTGMAVGTSVLVATSVVSAAEGAYWGKRTYENYHEHQDLEMAVLSGNMDKSEINQVGEAYSAFKDARFNALMTIPAVIFPGVGKLVSLSKGTKMANILSKLGPAAKAKSLKGYATFYRQLSKSKNLQKGFDFLISTGKLPAHKIHEFFGLLGRAGKGAYRAKKGIDAKFLNWMVQKLDKMDDTTKINAFMLKFKGIVEEGLDAATKACKI